MNLGLVEALIKRVLKKMLELLADKEAFIQKSIKFIIRWDILFFLLCSIVFISFPKIDLVVSEFFYDRDKSAFIASNYPFAHIVYVFFAKFKFVLLPALIVLAIVYYRSFKFSDSYKKWLYSFLLASLLLGPGIVVNVILKDNSIGRSRPVQIVEFGGEQPFSAAYEYSGTCEKNCSFVSGHAALGFFFIGLGWVFRSRMAFYTGVAIGVVVGLVRIMQGGHFLSDVVLAFWAVYFVNWLLASQFNIDSPYDLAYRSSS